MANAIKTTFTKMIEEEKIQLTLDKEEAKALFDVLSLIGGYSGTTRRKYIDSIFSALHELDDDFVLKPNTTGPYIPDISGTISFNERKTKKEEK